MIRMLGAMVDASERAQQLVATLEAGLAQARARAVCLPKRPKVFFEEWDDPLIAGIGWVSELIEVAGGIDIFADRRNQGAAKDRVVTAEEVVAREPDLIIGSWCGKKFRPERVAARPDFAQTQAVQRQDMYEIKSSLILQLGPAALTDCLAELQRIIERWATRRGAAISRRRQLLRKPRQPWIFPRARPRDTQNLASTDGYVTP
jgi:iron complex transport system substrate-binding protein